jgi:hypothetical protein
LLADDGHLAGGIVVAAQLVEPLFGQLDDLGAVAAHRQPVTRRGEDQRRHALPLVRPARDVSRICPTVAHGWDGTYATRCVAARWTNGRNTDRSGRSVHDWSKDDAH